jgi:hypothetical protein
MLSKEERAKGKGSRKGVKIFWERTILFPPRMSGNPIIPPFAMSGDSPSQIKI